ncbi:MAG: hypothetical protein IJ506_03505 [Clostridia bacterium]|nr:hypothetical protein [Clostridia bacterium]
MHNRNAVRYYILLFALFFVMFISNDFGLIDVEKTAIVMAVGIDREEDTFIVTSQIALPAESGQGASKTTQMVSRGKTVAEAFEEINDKTGWYPKLVFCKLILLGENAVKENVFDALDFFLRDEYVSEDCLLAVCDGISKDFLNVKTPTNGVSSVAIQTILSAHAERVGAVMPNTLREFSASSFGDSKSGYLPVVKIETPQESIGGETGEPQDPSGGEDQSGGSGGSGSSGGSTGGSGSTGTQPTESEKVFVVSETATFREGKQVGLLSKEETFAFGAMKSDLKLAPYTVETDGEAYTLTIKHNAPEVKLSITDEGVARLKVSVSLTAGIADFSKAKDENQIRDVGAVPKKVLEGAGKKLKGEIEATIKAANAANCDLLGVTDMLKKYENKYYDAFKKDILSRLSVSVKVKFKSIR